ncbi:probable glucan endo-1,3-beta-glucosidase BG5 [Raphanus sativus]|uniref:glucan endo-1,3-beta-D-glucosidase n=1 Tax=Raphanus sativus TaxID=3726 RepID=A0A6J0M174_RAPSA|nr:probable glucan endo-1,3-beta-glucosidase BG5 [Raphanus sativus]
MRYPPKKVLFWFPACISTVIIIIASIVVILKYVHDNPASNVGLNYGLLGDNLPPPSNVIKLYKSIGITKVRIFDPNTEPAKKLLKTNIEPYLTDVNITFITIGNKVIPGLHGPQVLPVMTSLTNLVKSRNLPISITTVVLHSLFNS